MVAKIIGSITTLPDLMPYEGLTVTRDQWIDLMLEQHDQCASHWCYVHWTEVLRAAYKRYGLPVPKKGALPAKEYSLVFINDLVHMLEATKVEA